MNIHKILCCCLFGLWQPVAAVEFDNSITATSQWMINTQKGDSQSLHLSLQPELNASFDNGWKLKSSFRLRAEAINGMQISDIDRDGYSDYSKPAMLNNEVELELREFYLQGEIGNTFLTLGKQQVVWGKADGLKVLDIVNPQSFREFILDDFDSSRIPLWTLNIEQSIADWDLQFLWIPDQTYHALPKQNARYAFTSPELVPTEPPGVQVNIEQARRPNNILLDSDVGLRATTFWKGWDITFNYLYQYNNLPVLRQKLSLSGGTPVVTITPEYERTHVFGTTFSNAFSDWVVRGEIGYFTEHYFIGKNASQNQGVVKSPELHYVLGLDWNAPWDVLLSGQFIQSWVIKDADKTTRDKLDTTITGLIRRNFMYDTLIAEVLVIANTNNGDGIIRPKISYEWQDNIKSWIGADIFYGDRQGVFGQFEQNDRVVVGLEFSF
ncbi:MAG: hypothetical protein KAR12_06720 [Methylococcales bacterium]|nr:hypothetical protein [Methylococcales bacterium]